MLCPKCKTERSDKSLKCSNCGARVGRLCPNCKTHNVLSARQCKNCGTVLLITCHNCGATNTAKSETCRRCGAVINPKSESPKTDTQNTTKTTIIDAMPKYEAVYYSQQKAKDKLKESVLNHDVKVVGITGTSGSGKNLVIKFVSTELKDNGYVWLSGKCSKHTLLTPMGYIQDVLMGLFNLNSFCIDIANLKKESVKFFKQDFSDMPQTEVHDFINLLYPENLGEFKNIHANRKRTFEILLKVFKKISQSTEIVLVIDNFSEIDAMSLEFVKQLLKNPEISGSLTVVLTYDESRSAQGCLPDIKLPDSAYENIAIAPLTREHLSPILD